MNDANCLVFITEHFSIDSELENVKTKESN